MVLFGDIWYADPGWWIGIFIGILATVVVAVLVYFKQRNRKQISYQVLSDAPIVNIDGRVEDNVKITYIDNDKILKSEMLILLA